MSYDESHAFRRSRHQIAPIPGNKTKLSMSTSPVKAAHDHAKLLTSLEEAANVYPKPDGLTFTYGTAGFRTL